MRLFISLLLFAIPVASDAHSGGLNKDGCHNNRKTGDYHCHRGSSSPAAATSVPNNYLAPRRPSPQNYIPAGRTFRNCTEARAAGAAPVRRGEPGYGPHLDRDNDGTGCEPYRGR